LDEQLKALGAKELILAGFMTHMCISSTARAGCELGYQCTVVVNATATRALPGLSPSSVVDAKTLKEESSLAAIQDFNMVDDLKQ
jgi:nicotinamidase-related amidase